jgi:ATP phosphoribosyltransferase
VPRSWIDVSTMHDLDDVASAFHHKHHRRLRVATKYVNITRDFFARHGIADYRIVESLGATEGAPASGAAEAIVDITTTGATLAANNLKILDDGLILESQAILAASLRATWTDATRKAVASLLDRLVARQLAKTSAILRVRMDDAVEKSLAQLERAIGLRVLSRPDAGGGGSAEVALLVPNANLTTAINALRGLGATGAISTETAEYVFLAENPLYAALVNQLPRG